MATEYKTLTFPNNDKGQAQKIAYLQEAAKEGWVVVSETITPGKFNRKKACFLSFIFIPCALCAGSSDGTINVTLMREVA